MKALQLHYTSCRKGQSGQAGFQTRALSKGIRSDEQSEITRKGAYRPPRDAPAKPDSGQIASEFPKALRFYRLESGRYALTRSCYTGLEYSGRWGNFFAHTLVAEDGLEPERWPIDYYEWTGWQEGLDPQEDTEEMPPPLPAVDLGQVPPAESFNLEELREFVKEEPGRLELLARMVRAVLLRDETSRALVIRDSAINGLFWIACIQKLFPPTHATALSFCTYQHDPRGCADVNATTGETDFAFDEAERRYRFFEFDLTTGVHSEVPDVEDDYPALAARWLHEDADLLDRFFQFMSLFEHRSVEPSLSSALHLFALSEGEATEPEGERLAAMIEFAARFATAEGRVRLLDVVSEQFGRIEPLKRSRDYESVLRFLTDGAAQTGLLRHRAAALEAWKSLVLHHLLQRGEGLEIVQSTWADMRTRLSGHLDELASLYLSEPVWEAETTQAPSPEPYLFLLAATKQSLEDSGNLPAWQQPELGSLTTVLIREWGLQEALKVLKLVQQPETELAAMIRLVLEVSTQLTATDEPNQCAYQIGAALQPVLASAPKPLAESVRRDLDQPPTREVLFGEWQEICRQARDPLSAYERYQRDVLTMLPEYRRHCGLWVASSLLKGLPESSSISVALTWLENRRFSDSPQWFARQCLELANRGVTLDPKQKKAQEAASLVAQTASELGLALTPDRPLLCRALIAARNGSIGKLPLKEVGKALRDIDSTDYQRFLAGFLEAALNQADNKKEHQQALLALYANEHVELLKTNYWQYFKSRRKNRWPECLQGALKFWLAFDSTGKSLGHLAPLEKTGMQGLALALSKLNAKRYQAVQQSLNKARVRGRPLTRWRWIEGEIERRKQGLLSRLRKLLPGN